MLRRLVWLGLAAWIARWAALELASFAGHRLLPRGPAPRDVARPRDQ